MSQAYDKSELYQHTVKPLMDQVFDLCKLHGFNFIYTAAVSKAEDGGTEVFSSTIITGEAPQQMKAAKHLLFDDRSGELSSAVLILHEISNFEEFHGTEH